MNNTVKIAILGTRGIPAGYGGFETFAEHLSQKLVYFGYDVTVYCEDTDRKPRYFHEVKLEYSKYKKSANPLLFYLDSLWNASKSNTVLIVAGTGGSFFYLIPVVRKVVIMTNVDGLESKRGKWSFFKKLFIKLTERIAVKMSDVVIADSHEIKRYIMHFYKLNDEKVYQIEYGAEINDCSDAQVLEKYSLKHHGYYLIVARLEPENNIHMIIDGYLRSNSRRILAIIGNIRKTDYINTLLRYRTDKVRFLDGIYDKRELNVLRKSCFAYMHGHSVGGTNPSLLEALGSGNICICHDNPFNREVTDSQMYYFDNQDRLASIIDDLESTEATTLSEKRYFAQSRIINYYNWTSIAEKYRVLLLRYTEQIGDNQN